jgi:phosphomethylpyrimidine synthase
VREYAESHKLKDVEVAVEHGMEEKAEQFKRQGAEIYKPV